MGYFGAASLTITLSSLYLYRYDPGAGGTVILPSAWTGLIMLWGNVVGGVSDPWFSLRSDQSGSRFGRRRIFIAAASLPLALSFFLAFNPPTHGGYGWSALYLALCLTIFNLALSAFQSPYLARLPELESGAKGRLALSTWLAGMAVAGTAFGMTIGPWLAARYGYIWMGAVLGLICLIALSLPLMVREAPTDTGTGLAARSFLASARGVFSRPELRLYYLAFALIWATIESLLFVSPFLATHVLGESAEGVVALNGLVLLAVFLGFVPTRQLAARIGKVRALAILLSLSASAFLLVAILSGAPAASGLRAAGLWAGICLAGTGLAAAFVLPNAILADLAPNSALSFSFQSIATKIGAGLAVALGGTLLSLGAQADSTFGIRLVFAQAFVAAGAAAWVCGRLARMMAEKRNDGRL
jgi:Na+/melibiose symporter-like transporter